MAQPWLHGNFSACLKLKEVWVSLTLKLVTEVSLPMAIKHIYLLIYLLISAGTHKETQTITSRRKD
jgi:hypothetical protein